jgi:ion channel
MAILIVASLAVIVIVLWDAFEAVVLPRRVTRRFRLTSIFFRSTWFPYATIAKRLHSRERRETFLGFYGPLSLFFLLGFWAVSLIVGFAVLQWAVGSPLSEPQGMTSFTTYFYLSSTTFFTFDYGDVVPLRNAGRMLAVVEAGTGYGFLAIIIAYLPVVYQAFSRREVNISLLDARAGSPPTAFELLRRHSDDGGMKHLDRLLRDWERWSAELLESHLSYPLLCYYRSQHDHQSWLSSLTAILDTCALVMVGLKDGPVRQAQLTYAIARHTVVDLAQTFNAAPRMPVPDRLPPAELERLRTGLKPFGLSLDEGEEIELRLKKLRRQYEPYLNALAERFLIVLPPWAVRIELVDNWQTSAWEEPIEELWSSLDWDK